MGEAAESEGGTLDAFDENVDRLGGAVGDPGAVPVGDRDMPAGQGAAQAAQIRQAGIVGRIVREFAEVRAGELGTVDVIEPAEGFFGVPRRADLPAWVPDGEQATELGIATFAEPWCAVISRRAP